MKKLLVLLFIFLYQIGFSQSKAFNFYFQNEESEKILHLESFDTFPCAGYGITTHLSWQKDTLIIDIRGFQPPTPCYSTMDIAQQNIPLTETKTKIAAVKFRWDKKEDIWKVKYSGTAFNVTPLRTTFTSYMK